MVRPERVELPTYWFVASRSIQLSYGRTGMVSSETIDRISGIIRRRNANSRPAKIEGAPQPAPRLIDHGFYSNGWKGKLMRVWFWILLAVSLAPLPLQAKVVVFWQPGFPTVASQPADRAGLDKALGGLEPAYIDEAAIAAPDALDNVDLLVLPYGSAFPAAAWKSIQSYLGAGGNLLILGGQPLRVPVTQANGQYAAAAPQDTYSRALGFPHTYEVPVAAGARFQWRTGYSWLPALTLQARHYFAVEGRLDGLGYMVGAAGQLLAAPVITADYGGHWRRTGSRIVALDFDPQPGYWQSEDGIKLVQQAARYALQGAAEFSVEMHYSAIRPNEAPEITVHLRIPREQKLGLAVSGSVEVQLRSENAVIDTATLPVTGKGTAELDAPFHQPLPKGFYEVTAVYSEGGKAREYYENGFLVTDLDELAAGPSLGTHADFLTLDGKPFFPVGTNYFSTEDEDWDFTLPRNAAVWDHDFAEMAAHGVSFVRTGVWAPYGQLIEGDTGAAKERFLRNVEAFLACAHRHNIAINFTFFAFTPRSVGAGFGNSHPPVGPQPNPYLDPTALASEQAYVRSVVTRFKDIPWLCWDLINEPSFSNPLNYFKGNYPNGDEFETTAWHKWLAQKYVNLPALASAWRVPASTFASFDAVPLPPIGDLRSDRYGNPNLVRALDYNLFAQDGFSGWVRSMVALIHATGSKQLVNVGQDEGGVGDRVLNQFYGSAGVSFTTNHTYWNDDALFWDSVVAKLPGMPNITGETGYQPVWEPDGSWRYDELTGADLIERKWALGFAAGSSGAMQWDWARESDFGMLRNDGSEKLWENPMRELGEFARQAAPFANALINPDVAIVLPQSYQLSVANGSALGAQQAAVRALYQYARGSAYAVGEYQIELLGSPKLILLPSPFGLTEEAWQAIEQKVRGGAVLLVTGPFGEDAHFHATGRQDALGLSYARAPLTLREDLFRFPGGDLELEFPGGETTVLSRAVLPDGKDWKESPLGKGKILFAALPLELNGNLRAVADVYRYALKAANITPSYTTTLNDPGILICPTLFPKATLYVITSESNQSEVVFTDQRSGKKFSGALAGGRAALLLVGIDGKLIASYNWPKQ